MPQSREVRKDMNKVENKRMPQRHKERKDMNKVENKRMPQSRKVRKDMNKVENKRMPQSRKVRKDMNKVENKRMPQSREVRKDMNKVENKRMPQSRKVRKDMNKVENKRMPQRHKERKDMNKVEINKLSKQVIGCALEVHKRLGPGLLESVYEKALCIELKRKGIPFERQKTLHVTYRGESVGIFRVDVLVKETIVLELKSVERHDPVFEATILSYLKLGEYRLGLLINFNSKLLKDGIKRFVNNL